MFVDFVKVTFIAGKGGNGCIGFRREKFVPKGGPDGGDGGNGGSIILKSILKVNSLFDFRFNAVVKAEKGKDGSGSNKMGRRGKDKVLYVPYGTVIKTHPDEKLIFDFMDEDNEFIITKGGRGGLGNAHFKSSLNQTPKRATKGKKGETIDVVLELKLIAFAGLVGFPNAGKSTLISKLTDAKPKIADYPFTTLSPNLGVVYNGLDSLVIADIPGIIEGAHAGEGMGVNFLKHIERNKVLIFLIDASGYSRNEPMETFSILWKELESYKTTLIKKKLLVAANKLDLIGEKREKLNILKKFCKQKSFPYMEISALTGINLDQLKKRLFAYFYEKK